MKRVNLGWSEAGRVITTWRTEKCFVIEVTCVWTANDTIGQAILWVALNHVVSLGKRSGTVCNYQSDSLGGGSRRPRAPSSALERCGSAHPAVGCRVQL